MDRGKLTQGNDDKKVTFDVDFRQRKPDKELDVNWRTIVISVVASTLTTAVIGVLVLLSALDAERQDSVARSRDNCNTLVQSREEGKKRKLYSDLTRDILLDPRFKLPLEYQRRAKNLPELTDLKAPNCSTLGKAKDKK